MRPLKALLGVCVFMYLKSGFHLCTRRRKKRACVLRFGRLKDERNAL